MNKRYNYDINLSWSAQDECWVAMVPELKGCMADGETPEAAVLAAQDAIDAWLDAARHFGHPVPVEAPGVAHLAKAGDILNTAALARLLGINARTLAARIQRGTPLSHDESEALKKGLQQRGVALI
ncbi:type II toxin-antitoxin system HicB family antitoxin [Akkermansia glycaniphila]|uniref:type II toxin-antitoxin system HicB family antitoxin n=1 Tax=Akkermansia glycaniphila TaxID=1679444 RepID=UPI001C038E7D|nr:type II toxin-antitoxin system HicB family antitoxin [Akkermansia glycaniphila]MBT9449802.1 type II toxin-antitoxin system HicB family antitoxin [Akkermansia glycaniphila]